MSIKMTLETLGKDGMTEIVDRCLSEICANINDPNTDPKAMRSITMAVKIKPDANRSFAQISYSVTPKLAPVKPVEVTGLMDRDANGEITLHIPEIGTHPDQVELPINVTKLPTKEAQNG